MAKAISTMEQHRARYALTWVEKMQQQPATVREEVRRYVNGLPALIRMNGLGQAMAFYRMKGTDSTHFQLYKVVGDWLCGKTEGQIFNQQNDVLEAITQSDMISYMAAQNEALALLEWLKKLALALIDKPAKTKE